MVRKIVMLIVVIVMSSSTLVSGAAAGNPGKVDICHKPPGNPTNVRHISVGQAAVQAHLAHGDSFSFGGGFCGGFE